MPYIKKLIVGLILITLALLISGCGDSEDTKETVLTVSAAASLREALEDTGNLYMNENPDIKLIFNFAGSGSLQQQIIQGAPVDLFISAAEDKYSELISKKLIPENLSVHLLSNELVLIVPKNGSDISDVDDLLKTTIERIAIGTPETVPAGHYAKQYLRSSNIWEQLSPKIIPTKDVRQVLAYVESGNVDAGIVYKTDAMISEKVQSISLKGEDMHDPIIYPAGVVAKSKNQEEAARFLQFLQEQTTMEIFKKYGFDAALD